MITKHKQNIALIVFFLFVALTRPLQAAYIYQAMYATSETLVNFFGSAKKKHPDKEVLKKWFEMAKTGNRKQLEELYNNYEINLNHEDYYKYTALHKSAKNGHLAIVKYLVEQGADIKTTNGHGDTALQWAKKNDRQDIADYLISKGAQ